MRATRRMLARGLLALVFFAQESAMAIDLVPLWDHAQPAASEQRFRAALEGASGDDALVLKAQIARTYGLRKDFDTARRILAEVEPRLGTAGREAQVHYWLELGRTHASATHAPAQLTDEARGRARAAFQTALDTARAGRLDGLAIDAIHMFAFIDTAPADQLKWAQAALAVVDASDQPEAKRWEASIRNNLGHALHQLGRYGEALAQFEAALAIRQRGSHPRATRVAQWMVAWTLRSLDRPDEALAIQLRLEQENDSAGQPDPYVIEELETLYRAKGDLGRADHYARRRQALADQATSAALKALGDRWDRAIVARDRAAIEANMADDFRQIDGAGNVETKASFVAGLLDPKLRIDPYTVEDFEVRLYGDVALLSGRTRMTGAYDGKPFTSHYRYIDVYVRRNGNWQIVSVQISKIQAP